MPATFQFEDTLLIFSLASFSVDTIAKRFPQLDLADSASLDQLREEFIDFTLSPCDLPTPGEYHAADGTIKPRTGIFWSEVGKLKTLDGKARFPKLFQPSYNSYFNC